MDAEQQVTQCSQQFLSHPNRQNLSNVDAFKYIFLKFSKYSSCTIATCDNRDYRNGPFNAYEINLDSVDFDFAKNFVLEVTAEDCPQTKHRFLLVVTEDPDLDVMIVVKTIGVKPIRSCAAAYSSNPLLVPTEHLPKYLRKLWSRFDTDFFRPMFEQPIYNLPMSQGSSGSLSRCSSL
ncbi:uncharacterized protein LOC135831343 [Planococcus citri]|uniref:uncharacterized protein LOC135831343 n=1 Tax=Planococcus citri TaxID=170843 RepID=UPI0031F79A1F